MRNSKVGARPGFARSDGRPVLQPTCNRVVTVDPSRPSKRCSTTPAYANKRSKDPDSVNSGAGKPNSPKLGMSAARAAPLLTNNARGGSLSGGGLEEEEEEGLFDEKAPGSLAAALKEHASLLQAQRKMRIAQYSRAAPKRNRKVVPAPEGTVLSSSEMGNGVGREEKRCSFITPSSDPIYVAYHDEEWGVPVHDDKILFELLVLSGAQVGLDWTTILKRREALRSAFSGFDVEEVSKLTEKQIASISTEYGIDWGRVQDIVDNSNRILEVRKEFGSLNRYLWGFVNNHPISTHYRSCRKIPVKTSKSEAISKDMVRRGFRFVGPTIIHSFMQAAGLTNDHLVTCPHHSSIATLHQPR